MSIATEITRLQQAKVDIKAAIEEKGVTVGDGTIDTYAEKIAEISGGEEMPVGYLKVDPAWTNFDSLCYARPSMIKHLKYSDTANGTSFLAMFSTINAAQTTENVVIPSLDYRNGKNFNNMFIYGTQVVEIGEMDISNATSVNNMFMGCSGLQRITFAKGCIKLSINFSSCGLLDDISIQSIIDGLADMTSGSAQVLTLHADIKSKLTQDQLTAITEKNWSVA